MNCTLSCGAYPLSLGTTKWDNLRGSNPLIFIDAENQSDHIYIYIYIYIYI